MYYVTKNGMIHGCDTEERYRSFLEDGWVDYQPPKEEKKTASTGKKK